MCAEVKKIKHQPTRLCVVSGEHFHTRLAGLPCAAWSIQQALLYSTCCGSLSLVLRASIIVCVTSCARVCGGVPGFMVVQAGSQDYLQIEDKTTANS